MPALYHKFLRPSSSHALSTAQKVLVQQHAGLTDGKPGCVGLGYQASQRPNATIRHFYFDNLYLDASLVIVQSVIVINSMTST